MRFRSDCSSSWRRFDGRHDCLPLVLAMSPGGLLQTVGPYFAGLLTLAGVALTLLITGRRARLERRDVFLREQRELCSQLLGATYRYTKSVLSFSDYAYWTSFGEERARMEFEELQSAQLALHAELLRFRLIVEPEELVEACDELFAAYAEAYERAGHVIDAFWAFREVPNSIFQPRRSRAVGEEKGRVAQQRQEDASRAVKTLQ
jgi:hypothetical protein